MMMTRSKAMGAMTAIFLAMAGFAWVVPAHASAPVSNDELLRIIREQRAMIDAHRASIENLKGRLAVLEGQSDEVVGSEAAAGSQGETLLREEDHEEAGVLAQHDAGAPEDIRPIDLSVESDRTLPDQGMHIGLPQFNTKLTISGLIKADFIHDFRAMDAPAQFIPAEIVVPGNSDGQTTFSANPSRFVLATASETHFGRLTSLFSMDLFGDADGRTPDPRLRQAWGQLDGVLFGGGIRAGQSWSTWDDVPALPETLDFWGPNGSDQTRHPLLRWIRPIGESWTVWTAVEDPQGSVAGPAGLTTENDTRWPDGVLSAIYAGDWGQVKPALLLRDIGGKNASGTQRAFGWGVSASGVLNLPWIESRDNFRWQVQYGEGIGFYVNSDDALPDAVLSGTELQLIPVFAGYVALQHWWNETIRSNATFGWVDVDNQSLQAGDALDRTFYTSGNLIWSPVPQVDLGVEFLWGQHRNKNGEDGYDPRLQFSAHYRF